MELWEGVFGEAVVAMHLQVETIRESDTYGEEPQEKSDDLQCPHSESLSKWFYGSSVSLECQQHHEQPWDITSDDLQWFHHLACSLRVRPLEILRVDVEDDEESKDEVRQCDVHDDEVVGRDSPAMVQLHQADQQH